MIPLFLSIKKPDQTGNRPWGTTRSTGYIDIDIRPIHNWTVDYAGTISTELGPWRSTRSVVPL